MMRLDMELEAEVTFLQVGKWIVKFEIDADSTTQTRGVSLSVVPVSPLTENSIFDDVVVVNQNGRAISLLRQQPMYLLNPKRQIGGHRVGSEWGSPPTFSPRCVRNWPE